MFGHQDEPQNNMPGDSPAPATDSSFLSAPPVTASMAMPPSQDLLEPQATDGFTDAGSTPAPAPSSDPVPTQDTPVQPTVGGSDNLLDLKQQALSQLSPLVGHLDQSPEEKFRTTMMMIQASDNQDLLKTAYEAANQIPDEKARAQALLDVINEINYFTQHQNQ